MVRCEGVKKTPFLLTRDSTKMNDNQDSVIMPELMSEAERNRFKQIELVQTIRELFTYHPPRNAEEQQKHNIVNQAAIDFALTLADVIEDRGELVRILKEIQTVRMLANAAVCCERVEGLSYEALLDL